MCGIGLVVAGVRIDLSSILRANSSPRPTQPMFVRVSKLYALCFEPRCIHMFYFLQYLEYADRMGSPFIIIFLLLKFSWTKTPPSTSFTLAIVRWHIYDSIF